MKDLETFVLLSKMVGQRFDMVQAGGGNASVKCCDGSMLIKASGIGLSEIEPDKGISILVDDRLVNGIKPSMEVGMHRLLNTWVLHTHPLVVGMVVCRADWKEVLSLLFPEALLVDYCSPGEELACVLQRLKLKLNDLPTVIFLQNHGLVVHGTSADFVLKKTEDILGVLERFLSINFNRYRQVTTIVRLITQAVPAFTGIAYVSDDSVIQSVLKNHKLLFDVKPCCPDVFIYGGYEIVGLPSLDAIHSISAYFDRYNTYPRIVVHKDDVFFIASSVRKAIEAEVVFKAQLLMLLHGESILQSLSVGALHYLASMQAEQYRQKC